MYTSRTGLVLGFHGTDEDVVQSVLNGKSELEIKKNDYDWLGHGIYFWDNSPSRALSWAKNLAKRKNSSIKNPAVIGAIIDLGNCLDLLDYQNLEILEQGYKILEETVSLSGAALPENKGKDKDLVQRELDCAVIETIHTVNDKSKQYDSARGVFWEGERIYPNAGFRKKNHIQICVRNIGSIKGYFLPLPRITN